MVNVLVVEDEEDIRNLLIDQLQDKGCIVRKADNGAVALKRVAECRPDIIFVDIQMPVMDGFLFISELQESPDTFDILVVIVSAIGIPDVRARGEALGVKAILRKPWEQWELDLAIEQTRMQLKLEWEIPSF